MLNSKQLDRLITMLNYADSADIGIIANDTSITLVKNSRYLAVLTSSDELIGWLLAHRELKGK